jgi:hypothetical protein
VIDGQQGPSVNDLRSGQEVQLNLTSVTRQTSVLVTLHVSDSSCTVNLDVSKAILYN